MEIKYLQVQDKIILHNGEVLVQLKKLTLVFKLPNKKEVPNRKHHKESQFKAFLYLMIKL